MRFAPTSRTNWGTTLYQPFLRILLKRQRNLTNRTGSSVPSFRCGFVDPEWLFVQFAMACLAKYQSFIRKPPAKPQFRCQILTPLNSPPAFSKVRPGLLETLLVLASEGLDQSSLDWASMVETTFLNRFWICCQKRTFLILFWLVWYTKNIFSSFSGQPSTSGERDIWTSWFRLLHMAIPRIPTVGKKRAPKIWKRILRPIIKWTKKIPGNSEIPGAAMPDLRSQIQTKVVNISTKPQKAKTCDQPSLGFGTRIAKMIFFQWKSIKRAMFLSHISHISHFFCGKKRSLWSKNNNFWSSDESMWVKVTAGCLQNEVSDGLEEGAHLVSLLVVEVLCQFHGSRWCQPDFQHFHEKL